MSTSATTLPPTGQRHHREDAEMQDGEALTNGHQEQTPNQPGNPDPTIQAVAVAVAAMDEDAMDTTPDVESEVVLANDTAQLSPAIPALPELDGAAPTQPANHDPVPPVASHDDTVSRGVMTFSTTTPAYLQQTATELVPPIDPSAASDPSQPGSQPPPPPPPVEPVRSDSESSDEDEDVQPWHPVQEDTSSPDEEELKQIDESTEHSALDHEYWEGKAFLPLEDPEYTAGETGRIHWSIDAYNGTREKPNRDLVMKSDIVTIGGHQWQIKFYPKGNDSDYLSVYLDCLSVMDPKDKNEDGKSDTASEPTAEAPTKDDEQPQETPDTMENTTTDVSEATNSALNVEPQHAPLPLLDSKQIPKRKCVAAQVSVVLYNPTEPRVHYSRTALHCFCKGSPDWGWTRFHGPYYDIAHRLRGQRQALLRDDKLAFTGYVRIVKDETGCLWEHQSNENPWDSFAMTGLQGLSLGEDYSAPGGNLISAVASWMLFKPFRNLLYNVRAPDIVEEPFVRPKQLVSALQRTLYMLRTQVEPGAGVVGLDWVLDALEKYGIHENLDKLDVWEIWEILRAKVEEELQDTPHARTMFNLFGPKRDYRVGVPNYRVPVVGVLSMQEAVTKSNTFTAPGQALPELLTIELERQEFDLKTRSYVKLLNKVSLDDHIKVADVPYTLYGFVVHKQTLQSYVYQPILRPEGPGTRWYSYSDCRNGSQVTCLTQRQAIDGHEGKPASEQVVGNDAVAYIAMYVRDDVAGFAFAVEPESEQWDVPKRLGAATVRSQPQSPSSSLPSLSMTSNLYPADVEQPLNVEVEAEAEASEVIDFQVIDSRVFGQHKGPGIFDAYDPKWKIGSKLIHNVPLSSKDGCEDVRAKLANVLDDVQDSRQVKFWFLDPVQGYLDRPSFTSTGKTQYSSGMYNRYSEEQGWTLGDARRTNCRIWVHIVDLELLPKLSEIQDAGKEQLTEEQKSGDPQPTALAEGLPVITDIQEPEVPSSTVEALSHSEDTPMSEHDEPSEVQPVTPTAEAEADTPVAVTDDNDTAMIENEAHAVEFAMDLSAAVHELSADPTAPEDTDMSGTQDVSVPPPPPIGSSAEASQPPPPVRTPSPEPPPDEVYFFLKFWNLEEQVLEARGTHISLMSERVDVAVTALLGLQPSDKSKLDIWEEKEVARMRPLKHRRTFHQNDIHRAAIILVALIPTAEQRASLAARAAFADPQAYMASYSLAIQFPHKPLNGHFVYNYFSSEYYKGEMQVGQRHGHGTCVYHSGATYEGAFRLGARHGHGIYTFQNGDTYDGDWVENQQHGSGTFVEAATGNTYVGGWKNDKKFGEGVTHWKNAQEAERLCRICWDEPAEAAFYDCGHVVACLTCAREVQNCPVCRKRVLSAMKLYYVA